MTAPRHQADPSRVKDLLCAWIVRQSTNEEVDWLRAKQAEIESGAPAWKFFTAFSAVPRYLGKEDLEITESDVADARALRAGWTPSGWSIDQAGRTVLVLSYPHGDPDAYVETLDQVFSTADVRESVALYQMLPLFPHPTRFPDRCAEGLRTNMKSVFNAVAHDNPYPSEYLDDAAWNQMVLKALFIDSPLHKIRGLDDRANSDLARMLVDYAHERWAADRPVSPELWRPVGPFAGETFLEELERVLQSDDEAEREAAALALADAGSDRAGDLLAAQPDLKQRVMSGELTWKSFSRNRIPVPA
ncbi:MAG: EboA family metabolite traffic protein [Rhodothermales bacterium]